MRKSDAIDLFDLSEAGRLLLRDPVRLARQAREGRVPATQVEGRLYLPVTWVEAEAGVRPEDPEALRRYWLARLAPPSPDARRPRAPRDRLPLVDLLDAPEAARRLCADAVALRRLDVQGVLPSVQVDGRPRYDARLVDLLARAAEGEDVAAACRTRAHELRPLARFAYASGEDAGAPPRFDARPPPARPEPGEAPGAGAYEIPADLDLGAVEPFEVPAPPPARLVEAEGFDAVDEP